MLPRRAVLRSITPVGSAQRASQASPSCFFPGRPGRAGAQRLFGTSFRQTGLRPGSGLRLELLANKPVGAFVAAAGLSSHRNHGVSSRQVRHASTSPPPAVDGAAGAPLAATDGIPTDIYSSAIELTGHDLLDMPEQIGYLKALGLDFGWGPSSMMEWYLEHIYIYTGLPWWACITTVAVTVRLAMLKPSVTASEHSHKMQELQKVPQFVEAQAKMMAAAKKKDKMAMMMARQDVSMMRKASGIQMWRSFVPILNIPIAFGMVRVSRGMAALPVPSLETGGTLWFPDLTVADPLFILPIISAATLYLSMRMSLPYMAPKQARIMSIVGNVIAPLGCIITIYLPAIMQLYFALSGVLQLVQSGFLNMTWVRQKLGLRPLKLLSPEYAPRSTTNISNELGTSVQNGAVWQQPRQTASDSTEPKSDKGIVSSVKNSAKSVREKLDDYTGKKSADQSDDKAQAYESRRAAQEKERKLARQEENLARRRQKRGEDVY